MVIRYNSNKNLKVLPFIFSHLPEFQTTLIFGPDIVYNNTNQFRDKVYKYMEAENEIKSFFYKGFVAVCTIFYCPNIQEEESGRYGLSFTIGALFDKKLFKRHKPCHSYFDSLFNTLNQLLGVNFYQNGAESLLKQLKIPEEKDRIERKLKKNLMRLLKPELSYEKASITWWWKKPKFPFKILVGKEISDSRKIFISTHLYTIDKYLNEAFSYRIEIIFSNNFKYHIGKSCIFQSFIDICSSFPQEVLDKMQDTESATINNHKVIFLYH